MAPSPVTSSLIAAPQLQFRDLAAQLSALGWFLDSAATGSLLPGEPEFAVFLRDDDKTSIHYTFNPVVKLRVLEFRGPRAETRRLESARHMPVLSAPELRALLDSGDTRQTLLGLFAAEQLRSVDVLERVVRLCFHPEAKIARTAERVRGVLIPLQLSDEQARHPQESIWFSPLAQPELRRQVLRWLIHDYEDSTPAIDQVLRSALRDPDPEVRITAVLAAARLHAGELVDEIRAADIPTSTRMGAYPGDRFLYQSLRQSVVANLSTQGAAALELLNRNLEVRDDSALLLHSLATPVQLGGKPARLPEGVVDQDGAYLVARTNLRFRWIAPIPHWLGADSPKLPMRNPIRRITPESGFFIAELPMDPARTYEEAEHLCAELRQSAGLDFLLPTADQWEMAARGPDGRLFPWGNCLSKEGPLQPSPWLLQKTIGGTREWTRDTQTVCGGAFQPCASREAAGASDRCAVRPVLNWVPQ